MDISFDRSVYKYTDINTQSCIDICTNKGTFVSMFLQVGGMDKLGFGFGDQTFSVQASLV